MTPVALLVDRRVFALAATSLTLLTSSCQFAAEKPSPSVLVKPLTFVAAEYEGDVSTASWIPLPEGHDGKSAKFVIPRDDKAPLESAFEAAMRAAEAADDSVGLAARREVAHYSVNLFAIDREGGRAALMLRPGEPVAATFDRRELVKSLDELQDLGLARSLLSQPALVVKGETADVTLLDQNSFVSGYHVKREGVSMIADPDVAIAVDGFRVDLEPVGKGDELRMALTTARMQRPLVRAVGPRLYPDAPPVELQVPIFINERVVASSAMEGDSVFVFGGLLEPSGERMLVALVHPRFVEVAANR